MIDYKTEYLRICQITRIHPSQKGYLAWLELVLSERKKYEKNYNEAIEKMRNETEL